MKNLIKRIIRESIEESLFYKGRSVPDMNKETSMSSLMNKNSNYSQSGKFNVRTELIKLVIQFIRYNYPNELERYKGNFMYKLNKSMYYLSDDDAINYDSIFLKAVNKKDEKSIELANKFLSDIETDNIRKGRVFKKNKKISINNPIKERYNELKKKIDLCNKFLNTELTFNKWDNTKYGYNRLSLRFIDVGYKLLDEKDVDELRRLNNISGDKAGTFLKKAVKEKLIELENEMKTMINKYGEEDLI